MAFAGSSHGLFCSFSPCHTLKWILQLGLISCAPDETNTDSLFTFVKAPRAAVLNPPHCHELRARAQLSLNRGLFFIKRQHCPHCHILNRSHLCIPHPGLPLREFYQPMLHTYINNTKYIFGQQWPWFNHKMATSSHMTTTKGYYKTIKGNYKNCVPTFKI